jgi:hypothetical protein
MSFIKNSAAPGKKQAPMPGPNSPAYKKLLAAQKGAVKAASGHAPSKTSSQSAANRSRFSTAFTSLKSRQRIVERVKRAIWASVLNINDAIIKLALAGNYNAAKTLFDFAGVYSLPTSDDNPSAAASAPAEADADDGPPSPIDSFFRSIGVAPPCDAPEPDLAASSL